LINDFEFIYPDKINSLFETFPLYKVRILELAKTVSEKLRDNTIKGIFNEYLDSASGTQSRSKFEVVYYY
jgi:hypothetical protein